MTQTFDIFAEKKKLDQHVMTQKFSVKPQQIGVG